MIVYYLDKVKYRPHPTTRAKVFRGPVTFYDDSRSRAIKLGTATNRRPHVIFKATIFDDSTQPPTLIRCDYGFATLHGCGVELPPTYIDHAGRIVRTVDDVILMDGPSDGPQPSARFFDRNNNEISHPMAKFFQR